MNNLEQNNSIEKGMSTNKTILIRKYNYKIKISAKKTIYQVTK